MTHLARYSILLFLMFIVSCSNLSRSRQGQASSVDQKYVPLDARSSNIGLRKRILILPFIDLSNERSKKVSDAARDAFVQRMLRTNRYVVITTADLPKDIEQFRKSDSYDMEAVAKLAAQVDVAAIIEGSIVELKAKKLGDQVGVFRKIRAQMTAKVKIRTFNAKNQKEIFADTRVATVESMTREMGSYKYSDRHLQNDTNLVYSSISKAFNGSIAGLVQSIDKVSWEGRIAMLKGDRIFINAGRLSGLQIGDILRISSWGEEVYDPENGTFIGRSPGRAKGTVELVNYFGKDGGVAIIHSGGGFQLNDKVELY